jgi:hypothetical protein
MKSATYLGAVHILTDRIEDINVNIRNAVERGHLRAFDLQNPERVSGEYAVLRLRQTVR